MTTNQQLEEKLRQLAGEASGLDSELTAAREDLRRQSRERDAANKIAASIMVLESRRNALSTDIQQVEQELERRRVFVSSKEYKTAQKSMTDLESYFGREAQAVRDEMDNLHERLTRFATKYNEYADLLKRYRLDLTTIEQTGKLESADVVYLVNTFRMIDGRKQAESITQSIINSRQTARPREA